MDSPAARGRRSAAAQRTAATQGGRPSANKPKLLYVPQFNGSSRGGLDRGNQAAAQAPLLQRRQPGDRRPPGLATLSFNTAGCSPVVSTISAAPLTVWAARARATSRARPIRTPPSLRLRSSHRQMPGPIRPSLSPRRAVFPPPGKRLRSTPAIAAPSTASAGVVVGPRA